MIITKLTPQKKKIIEKPLKEGNKKQIKSKLNNNKKKKEIISTPQKFENNVKLNKKNSSVKKEDNKNQEKSNKKEEEEMINQKIISELIKEEEKKNDEENGKAIVKYSHYTDNFQVINGKILMEEIDEKYCISIVFLGDYKLHLKNNKKEFLSEDLGKKCFINCKNGEIYDLEIEEDIKAEEKRDHKAYIAPKKESLIRNQVDLITDEIKNLNFDEIKEKSQKYKELIEARDVEDILFK